MVKVNGISVPENCFRCFASSWYNYGGKDAGFRCRALPGSSKIISNCEARTKRRDDCPIETVTGQEQSDAMTGYAKSKYDLRTAEGISAAAIAANHRANQEPNQGSYNAGYLHGYADALREVSQQLKVPAYVEILVRREYASIVKALEDAEQMRDQDKRSVKKRELYQFIAAKEMAINDLCNILGIELRDENLNLID